VHRVRLVNDVSRIGQIPVKKNILGLGHPTQIMTIKKEKPWSRFEAVIASTLKKEPLKFKVALNKTI